MSAGLRQRRRRMEQHEQHVQRAAVRQKLFGLIKHLFGDSHAERPAPARRADARSGPTTLWGKRGGVN